MNEKTKSILHLNRIQSIVFLVIYGAITMAVRFYIEPFLGGNVILSTAIGLVMLAVIFLLVKIRVLNFQNDKSDSDG